MLYIIFTMEDGIEQYSSILLEIIRKSKEKENKKEDKKEESKEDKKEKQ